MKKCNHRINFKVDISTSTIKVECVLKLNCLQCGIELTQEEITALVLSIYSAKLSEHLLEMHGYKKDYLKTYRNLSNLDQDLLSEPY